MVCRNHSCFLFQLTFSLGKPISTLVSAVCLVELSLIAFFAQNPKVLGISGPYDLVQLLFLLHSVHIAHCLVLSRAFVKLSHRVGFLLLPRLGRTIRSPIHPVDGLPGMNPKQMMPDDASANMCKYVQIHHMVCQFRIIG